jgi:O-antigen ligase
MSVPGLFKTESVPSALLMILVCLTFLALSLGTAPLTTCGVASLVVWLCTGLCYQKLSSWYKQEWTTPVILLIFLPWVAMLWSSSMVNVISHSSRSYYWLFAFVAATAISSEAILRRVMICYVAGIVVTSLIVLFSYYAVIPGSLFMAGIILKGYITYSLLVVIAIALLAFFYKNTTSQRYRVLIAVLVVVLATSVTCLSGRSGYVALVLVSPWVFCTMFGRHRLMPVLVSLVVIFSLMFTSQKVRERIGKIPHEIKLYKAGDPTDTSVGARLEMWQSAWRIFTAHPLIGTGTAGIWHETNKVKPGHGVNHPHNSYLYVAANYGILGLVLYGWLLVITLKRAWLARKQLSGHAILAFSVVIMIGSLTDTQILSAATGIVLGFVVGIPTTELQKQEPCAS